MKDEFEKYNKSFKKFKSQILKNKGSNISINDFINWINNQDQSLDITIESFKRDWDYLENRILADIASSIWGKDYYYNILLNEDRQFLTSLEYVQEAKALVY